MKIKTKRGGDSILKVNSFSRVVVELFLVVLVSGCVTVSYHKLPTQYSKDEFIEINQFCRKYNLEFQFNTIDEIVELTSQDKDIRLIVGVSLVYFNGNFFYLKKPPFYFRGNIFLPVELGRIISSPEVTKPLPYPLPIHTIVIDPGHGGKDPGAISPRGLKEKDLNLKVSKYLKRELEKRGYKVYLTRERDVYLTLRERVEIAREKEADLFISVHTNANHNRKIRGVEVYYLSPKYFDSQTKALVMAENASLGFKEKFSKNTERILWDLLCRENNVESIELANAITYAFRKMEFSKVRTPRGAPFYVLKYAYVPAVLVEIGYLSNYYEEKLLRRDSYLRRIASAISLGVASLDRYYTKLAQQTSN